MTGQIDVDALRRTYARDLAEAQAAVPPEVNGIARQAAYTHDLLRELQDRHASALYNETDWSTVFGAVGVAAMYAARTAFLVTRPRVLRSMYMLDCEQVGRVLDYARGLLLLHWALNK